MANVKKRKGEEEAFDMDKVRRSIKKAATDAGLTDERIAEVTEQTSEKVADLKEQADVTTEQLRASILSSLDDVESKAADAWRQFDEKYKPSIGSKG